MPSTRDLLPETLSSLIESYHHSSAPPPVSSSIDLRVLREQLRRIPRSTWVQLGSEAHNAGFAAEMTAVLTASRPAGGSSASSVSMFSTAAAAAKAAALLTNNGMPRIVRRMGQRYSQRKRTQQTRDAGSKLDLSGTHGEKSQEEEEKERSARTTQPLLLDLYEVFRDQDQQLASSDGSNAGTNRARTTGSKSSSAPAKSPWELDFLRSGCPEVFVMVFLDCFLEYGPKHGYERDMPTDLMEAIDFEWRTNSGPAKRAVLALIQTLISCRRYAKTHGTYTTGASGTKGIKGDGSTATPGSEPPEPGSIVSDGDDIDAVSHQLALTLSEACTALELFFETERGRHLPKLVALYQQEVAADTKLLSRSGGGGGGGIGAAGAGTKRQYGTTGVGTSTGVGGAGVVEPMDPTGRKRMKSNGGTELALGSVESSSGSSSTAIGMESGSHASSTSAAGQGSLRDSSYYVEQALAGYPSALASIAATTAPSTATAAPTTGLSSLTMSSAANAQLQAKLNNPLWSPVLGVTHHALIPVKFAHQVGMELERWIGLLGQMDGAIFSEKLVGLIKAVYPSDQKFLLDQILVEYICWEGSGGSERDADADVEEDIQYPAFDLVRYMKTHSPTTITTTTSKPRIGSEGVELGAGEASVKAGIKTGEWIMETILGALVSLVIKPEESSTYLEPGSRKWIEPLEIIPQEEVERPGNPATNPPSIVGGASTAEGSLTSSSLPSGPSSTAATTSTPTPGSTAASTFRTSAAMGGVKKRRVRSLYNRRVSPFYAILAMFQPRRVTGRVTGMLYLGPEDVETKKPVDEKEDLLKQVVESVNAVNAAGAVRKLAASVAGAVSLEPIEMEPDAFREKKRMKKKKNKYRKRKNGDLDAEEEIDPRQRSGRTITKMDIDGQPIDADAVLQAVGRREHGDDDGESSKKAAGSSTTSHGKDKSTKEEEDSAARDEEDTAMKDESDPEGGDTVEGAPKDSAMEGVVEHDAQSDGGPDHATAEERSRVTEETMEDEDEEEEEDPLALAKKAEAARTVCHAPFKVLLFILQYLTKVNQAGALDAWITDALSATLTKIQVQYFEWILASLILNTSTPSALPIADSGNESSESGVLFGDELLRILGVLVVAQGIGYEPVKSAFRTVENGYQGPGAGEYWARVRAMLDGH
ncbi:hypothetical protein B0O80DRAFT_88356 [Mortierella sp. GBAus27b]|nr:hypothetical protein BGX31_002580 [Mortierella sp. GBA43]KAI8361868.1 hypothetical protein B0O80DRAFT_88356 [Mortierella sp. GBAus27b]